MLRKMNLIQIVKLITLLAVTESAVLVSSNNERIVGGESINISEAPFQVILIWKPKPHNWTVTGSGSIISEDLVLTSAHAYMISDKDLLCIRAGTTHAIDDNEGQTIKYKKAIVHEKYNEETLEYDIALLRLEEKLKLNDKVKIVPLASANTIINVGDLCTISGWGYGNVYDELRRISVPIIGNKKCNEYYSDADKIITENMICAGYEKGEKDFSYVDIGGPLIRDGIQIAIASSVWAFSPEPKRPGVYTSIPMLRQWIDNNSKLL